MFNNNKFLIRSAGILIILAILLFWGTLVLGEELTKTLVKTENFVSGGEISIKTVNGFITVHPWLQEQVSVSAEVKIRARSDEVAEDVLKSLELKCDRSGNAINVEIQLPNFDEFGAGGILSWLWGGDRPRITANLIVNVPFISSVHARSTNGKVVVDSLGGDVELVTTNGEIEIGPVSGGADLKSTNGHIGAKGIAGEVSAHTTNGGIDISLTKSGAAQKPIECRTVNGGIMLIIPALLESDIDAHTVNGGVTIRLDSSVQANLSVSTVNGRISTDFPVSVIGEISKKRLEGTIGKGGKNIVLRTVNGGVSVEKLR